MKFFERFFVRHWCLAYELDRPGDELDCEDCFLVLVMDVADMDAEAAAAEEPCTCTFCDTTKCPYCGHPKEDRSCEFCNWPREGSW